MFGCRFLNVSLDYQRVVEDVLALCLVVRGRTTLTGKSEISAET